MTDYAVGMNAGPGLLSRTMMCEITDESNIVQGEHSGSHHRKCQVFAAEHVGFAVFSPANTFGHTIGYVHKRDIVQ
jgi:hypothetical protein